MNASIRVVAVCVLWEMVIAGNCQATDFTWTGNTSDSWGTAVNWTSSGGSGIPNGIGDTVEISHATFDPRLDQDRSIGSVSLFNDGRLDTSNGSSNFRLIVNNNTSVQTNSELRTYDSPNSIDFRTVDLSLLTGGQLFLEGSFVAVAGELGVGVDSEITGFGTVEMSGTTTSDDFVNNGIIRASGGTLMLTKSTGYGGDFDLDGSSGAPGELRVLDDAKMIVDSKLTPPMDSRFTGSITVRSNAELMVNQPWRLSSLSPGGFMMLSGGSSVGRESRVSGDVFSIGSSVNVSGWANILAPANIVSGADIHVEGSAILSFMGATTFSDSDSFSGTGIVRLDNSSVVTTNVVVNLPGGVFDLDGGGAGAETITVNSGNDFVLNVEGIDTSPGNPFVDQINLLSGAKLEVNLTAPNESWTMAGALEIDGGGAGDISLAGSDVVLSGSVAVDGSTAFDARVDVTGTIGLETAGTTLVLQGGDSVDRNTIDGGSVTGPGTLEIANGAALQGNGALANTVNGGILAPGLSAGTTNVDGDFTQSAGGGLEIELGGLVAGSEFDQLLVTGEASLNGGLVVSLIGPFEPGLGDSFEIITATGGIDEMFVNESLPTLSGNLDWQVLYQSNSVELVVVLPGDYNFDGTVDAADYAVWRKNDGTPAGYNKWRDNFGQTAGSGSTDGLPSLSAVPEPISAMLMLWGLVVLWRMPAR